MDENQTYSIIKFSDVSIGYGRKIVLKNINLSIERNDFIGIVGPNGAGKTTFLKTLLGSIKPIAGKIEKNNLVFGYVPQRDIVQPFTSLYRARCGNDGKIFFNRFIQNSE